MQRDVTNIVKLTADIIQDATNTLVYFLVYNMRNFATILNILLPYAMLFIGEYVGITRGYYSAGGEIFLPVLVGTVILYIRAVASRLNKGYMVPVPAKRFTEISEDGEVSVEVSRTQELILYVADLEDYLERKGLL